MIPASALVVVLICLSQAVFAQNSPLTLEGSVTYVTSQTVYVKFRSTENFKEGDTLYIVRNDKQLPALIIQNISSISCSCKPVTDMPIVVGDKILGTPKTVKPAAVAIQSPVTTSPPVQAPHDTTGKVKTQAKRGQVISGSVNVASYLNFSDKTANSQRMRYTLSLSAQNIGNSKLSAETYITFAHKPGDWSEISANIFNGLKIYDLNVNYKFNEHHHVWFGRRINPRLSNVGAIDGLQYEARYKTITFGFVGGSRPDYRDYSFNASLGQYGGYIAHDLTTRKGTMQTTLAFMQQMNSGKTDRSFVYLQHVNSLVKNLYFFGSAEMDLYNQTYNNQDSTLKKDSSPKVSNLYLSLRYRPVRSLTLSLSYSARTNVIYYETYKDIVSTLLQSATINGYVFQVNYNPGKNIAIGVNAGYRDSKNDPKPTKNLYSYISFTRIPGLNSSATLSAMILETVYMSGSILSVGLNRDIVPGKFNAGIGYRYINYKFSGGESSLVQHSPDLDLTWRIMKKLSCALYYEGTFDTTSEFNRIYINLTQRF